MVAVDVGYGQLAWRLRTDERVRVLDRTNIRTLEPDDIGGPAELTVADLSFISLRLVLPMLAACTAAGGDLLPMVKPQFEVGRERLGSGGVVRDPTLRADAVLGVAARQPNSAGGRPACAPARCPARPATWNSSCGCRLIPLAPLQRRRHSSDRGDRGGEWVIDR